MNCNIVVDIEIIDKILIGNQVCEIFFTSKKQRKYKIVFNAVWDFRYAIENAYIDRSSKFCHEEEKKSNIFLIRNSDYVKYFKSQISGTRPVDKLKDYIVFDHVDTVIEILTVEVPEIMECF